MVFGYILFVLPVEPTNCNNIWAGLFSSPRQRHFISCKMGHIAVDIIFLTFEPVTNELNLLMSLYCKIYAIQVLICFKFYEDSIDMFILQKSISFKLHTAEHSRDAACKRPVWLNSAFQVFESYLSVYMQVVLLSAV